MKYVDTHTPSLFGERPVAAPAPAGHPRKAEIKRAYERVDQLFLDRYQETLEAYGSGVADFIAGDVTEVYEKRYKALSTSQKKALGGLYQRLMQQKRIEKTGEYRARNQGNASAVYRLKRRNESA